LVASEVLEQHLVSREALAEMVEMGVKVVLHSLVVLNSREVLVDRGDQVVRVALAEAVVARAETEAMEETDREVMEVLVLQVALAVQGEMALVMVDLMVVLTVALVDRVVVLPEVVAPAAILLLRTL
jgi:hypothetical protein